MGRTGQRDTPPQILRYAQNDIGAGAALGGTPLDRLPDKSFDKLSEGSVRRDSGLL